MSFDYSVAMIAPADQREAINSLAAALGYGPDTLSVPLSTDGTEPATHYGAHAWARQAFIDVLDAGRAGTIPPELEQAGYTGAEVAAVLDRLYTLVATSSDTRTPRERFVALCDEHGLQRIEPEEP